MEGVGRSSVGAHWPFRREYDFLTTFYALGLEAGVGGEVEEWGRASEGVRRGWLSVPSRVGVFNSVLDLGGAGDEGLYGMGRCGVWGVFGRAGVRRRRWHAV